MVNAIVKAPCGEHEVCIELDEKHRIRDEMGDWAALALDGLMADEFFMRMKERGFLKPEDIPFTGKMELKDLSVKELGELLDEDIVEV